MKKRDTLGAAPRISRALSGARFNPLVTLLAIYKFSMVILNENRWSTNCTPTLVGTKLVEVFLHLGLNQVQGLILGLVFQVGGLRLSVTRVQSASWTRDTDR